MLEVPTTGFTEFLLHRESFSNVVEILIFDKPISSFIDSLPSLSMMEREDMKDWCRSYQLSFPNDVTLWLRETLKSDAPTVAARVAENQRLSSHISDSLSAFRLYHVEINGKMSITDYQDHPIEPRSLLVDSLRTERRKKDFFDPLSR